jgi:hypothetical protein
MCLWPILLLRGETIRSAYYTSVAYAARFYSLVELGGLGLGLISSWTMAKGFALTLGPPSQLSALQMRFDTGVAWFTAPVASFL